MEVTLNYQPDGAELEAYIADKSRVCFIMGALGSGKTFGSCYKVLRCMQDQAAVNGVRKSRWLAVRNTYSDLLTTTVKDWLELFETLGRFKQGSKEPPTHHLNFLLPDETRVVSEVIFLALDRPDDVKKLRGSQVTGFWLNEVKELDKAIVDMADLRHGRYPSKANGGCTWHGIIGDTNAPDEDHWYFRLAEIERPEGWSFHRQPGAVMKNGSDRDQFGRQKWVVNPLAENMKNLPDGYYQNALGGKSEDWIKVNLANEYGFVSDGKPVHPEYTDSIHCSKYELEPSRNYPITLGFDWGRTPACAFIQKTSTGGWIVFDEFVSEDMSAAQFAPELKRYIAATYPDHKFTTGWGDPAGTAKGQATEKTPFDIMRAHGIQVRPTNSNDPLKRRAAVSNPLTRLGMDGQPGLLISPKCKMLRKGLNGGFCYKRVQAKGERYKDEPDKNEFSHIVESLEYGLMGSGEGLDALKRANSSFNKPVIINKGFNSFPQSSRFKL